jgi:N-acetylglucosaminyldiphosphoundecaprenol N-acetyl-beta-D-mannosaminyltransferase
MRNLKSASSQIDISEETHSQFNSLTGIESPCQSGGLLFPTFEMLGTRVQAITGQDLVRIIADAVANRARYVIANHNMHSLYLWHHDEKMRELYSRADFIHIDGMALVALSRLMGSRLQREHRTTYVDFWPTLAADATRHGWRIYCLGSKPEIADLGARRLREQYPGLQLRVHHGYFDPQGPGNDAVLEDIRAYAPDVLMVGMGMPRQEQWIHDNLSRIEARSIFCVGCLMDYVAGHVPTCPRWLASVGFEWLYRLVSEPARLWHRYLVEPWFILGQLAAAHFKIARTLGGSDSIAEENR